MNKAVATKFYILDEEKHPVEVSEAKHIEWKKASEDKYNKFVQSTDGQKSIDLYFVGIQKNDKELNLFSVEHIFRGYDFEIINDFVEEFDN